MEFPVRAFPLMHYPMAFLVAVTAALLAWHQFGMNRELVLGPASGHAIEFHDDRTEGGDSVSSLTRSGGTATFECRIGTKYEWPYCDLSILLAKAPEGVDLTGFDTVTFDMSYEGEGPRTVRFYIRNFEPEISHVGDWRTLKVNEIEFTVPESGQITIPVKLFRVASWWTVDMKVPLFSTDMRIDRVPYVEMSTGSVAQPGLHRIELRSIRFRGKWISQTRLLMLLVGAWLMFGISWLAAGLLHFRARLKGSKERLVRLQSLNHALHLETRELAGQARIDPLTGALNREGLRDFMMRQTQGRAPIEASMSVIFTDIDYFKQINDRHGHAAGDEVLQRFAQLLQGEIRAADRLVRWGGEEFLIVCPHTDAAQGAALAEKLRVTVERQQWPHGLHLTTSFGVAAHVDKEAFGDTIKRADAALYRAKEGGRNRVETA